MIVWATEFPLAEGTTTDELLLAAKRWLTGSPYLPWTDFEFADEPQDEIVRYEHSGQVVSVVKVSDGDEKWCGLQHIWTEDGEREWTTDIVAHQNADELHVGVRLDCNLLAPGMRLPRPHKPYFMRQFLERFGGGADSWLTVSDEPTLLEESQVADAAAIIHGTTSVRLPIVYVSATTGNKPFIDAAEVARWLSGMAHIVVEPSKYFSFALAHEVDRSNPYAGAVSVFWPRAVEPQVRFVPNDFATPRHMGKTIVSRVRTALVAVRPTPQLTWLYLRELVSRRRLDALRRAGDASVKEYVEAFDAEIAAKDLRLAEAEREIARLHAEVRRAEAASASKGGLLRPGKEPAFYPGEHQDALLAAITYGRGNLDPEGRRLDIVDDILAVNQPSEYEREIAAEIKRLFAANADLTSGARRGLEDLGFQINDDGKHYKATYQGDGRYTFAISKTGSDHRAGKNLASQIIRRLFK